MREAGGAGGFDKVRLRAFGHFAENIFQIFSEIGTLENQFENSLGLTAAFAQLQNLRFHMLELAGENLAVVDDEVHFFEAAAKEVTAFVER